MATKSSTKKTKTKHDLLYIMSNSCGWCKKSDPIVDELISEGHKITKLDVMNPDEAKTSNEAKSKHGAQCGTPLFLDAETGNQVCGFREKDVIEKWAKGEEIPKPPTPKTPPPTPPQDLDDEKQVSDFKTAYEKWVKENDHMPKLLPFDDVINRMKQARAAQAQQGGAPGAPGAPMPSQVNPDPSIKKTMDYYYIIENNDRQAVVADAQYINGLKQQYYYREPNGYLTKVVGDTNWNKKSIVNSGTNVSNAGKSNVNPTEGISRKQLADSIKAGNVQISKDTEKVAKAKLDKNIKISKDKKVKTAQKSKTNKKTIESF